MEHAFVIPAYRESPYLAQCLATLRAQVPATAIVITTSTPNAHIERIAREFDVPIRVAGHRPAIAADWNYALTATDARLVTLAHQDDLYAPGFARLTLEAFRRHPDADLAFTAFSEHSATGPRPFNPNLLIKRALTRSGFGLSEAIRSPSRKRRVLALGNPICCPSVTLNRERHPGFRFAAHYRSNLDWDAWERLSAGDGRFIYLSDVLVSHRVHRDTETTAAIAGGIRDQEDRDMLERFWPAVTASLLARIYRLGYAANQG